MKDPREATARLLELMARLRDPKEGCPWDRKQTFATIAPYTIEEAYEVADAIDGGDPEHGKRHQHETKLAVRFQESFDIR